AERLPVRGDGVHKGKHVGYAYIIHRAGVQLGRQGDASKGRIATITAAIDGNPGRVCDSFINQPVYAIGHIVLHGASPLLERGFPELTAIAGGSPEIHLQYSITPVGQKLYLWIKTPSVSSPGSSVWVDDYRKIFGLQTLGQGKVSMYGKPVAGGIGNGFHNVHVVFFQSQHKIR